MKNLVLRSKPFRNDTSHSSPDSSSPLGDSLVTSYSNVNVELTNDILMWNSYGDFSEFCAKIGLLFTNIDEAKCLFEFYSMSAITASG